MEMVLLGHICRPHGYKGAFITKGHSGKDSALGYVSTVWIGKTPEESTQFKVEEAAWMPKGWKIKLSDWQSDEQVNDRRGYCLFARREELNAPEESEFYVADLIGAKIIDFDTKGEIGTFVSVEKLPGNLHCIGHDLWCFEISGSKITVPATKRFIVEVNPKTRQIWIQNWMDLL